MKRKKKLFLILVMFLLITSGVKIVENKNGVVTAFVASASVSSPETKEQAQLQKTASVAASTAKTLKSYLENKNHPGFLSVALAIENSCRSYDLPFETVLAIAIFESGYGESDIAKQKRNFFGIAAYDESPESASDFSTLTLQEAIDMQILLLKRDYFTKYRNLYEISRVYCRKSDLWLEEVEWLIHNYVNFEKEVTK